MADVARVPTITGLVLGLLVAGLLVTSPSAFVGKGATFIDTQAWADEGSGAGGVSVETTSYLRSSEGLGQLPQNFSQWRMSSDVSDQPGWQSVKETFKADKLLSRYYAAPGLYTPIHTFIIDSQYTRVLHSLPVSYGLQGFEQQSSKTVRLNVTNATWLSETSPNQQIPVVEGTFVKTNGTTGNVTEKRLVQYYWVKREAWGVTNHVTWVGTNMRVPTEGDVSDHRQLLSNFTADLTGQMFVPEPQDTADTVAVALYNQRPLGPVLLGGSILVPIALVAYGLLGGLGPGATGAAAGGTGTGSGTGTSSTPTRSRSSSSSSATNPSTSGSDASPTSSRRSGQPDEGPDSSSSPSSRDSQGGPSSKPGPDWESADSKR